MTAWMTACRIGIVEDHTVVITGLRQLLGELPELPDDYWR